MVKFLMRVICLVGSALIYACGGGGGGGSSVTQVPTPAPVTITVTCPDGSSQIAATLKLAEDACPAAVLLSISPAKGDASVSPDTISDSGIVVESNSSLAIPDVKVDLQLSAGVVIVPVTVTVPVVNGKANSKILKISPSSKLLYGQLYTYKFSLKDGLGKALVVEGAFTTSVQAVVGITCPTSSVADAKGEVCIYPKGVTLAVPLIEPPAAAILSTDAALKKATIDGTVLLIETDIKATNTVIVENRTRPLLFAVYRLGGKTIAKVLFKDDLKAVVNQDLLTVGMNQSTFDRVMGATNGLIIRGQPGNVCWYSAWFGDTPGFTPGFYFDNYNACPVWN